MASNSETPASAGNIQPILGGMTDVTLTSAVTLQSLGVSVTPIGSASLDGSGTDPVASFPITGGSEGPGSDAVILHQGGGLELKDSQGTVDLQDFRIDTVNATVDANVTVNGSSVGNVAVFALGPDSSLTLTPTAAGVVDQALGTTAITPDVTIGTAAPMPQINEISVGVSLTSGGGLHFAWPFTTTQPIVGGETTVALTAAATLQSLGVTVTALGSASLDTSSSTPVAAFPITGGTEGPGSVDVILHQGSGLELSDAKGTVDLRDFLIDTKNNVVDANVSANGTSAGNVAVFDIGSDLSLSLTSAAAQALDTTLGTTALTAGTAIGTASPSPIALPTSLHGLLASMGQAAHWLG